MRVIGLFLVYLNIAVLLSWFHESGSLPFETFFIWSKRKCAARCINKHGYFINDHNQAEPVTKSKIKLKVKCSCKPTRSFLAKLKKEYGKNSVPIKYYLRSFISTVKVYRYKLWKIQFLTAEEYRKNQAEKTT